MSRSFVKIVKMSCGVAHVSTNSYVIKRIQRIPMRIEIFLGYFSIRADEADVNNFRADGRS
jgi:hypothetical protein